MLNMVSFAGCLTLPAPVNSKDRLRKNMNKAFADCVQNVGKQISDGVAKGDALRPFPEYKDGGDAAFLESMTSGKRHMSLSEAVDSIERGLAKAAAFSEAIGASVDTILPAIETAKQALTCFTEVSTITTCLRIITSKAGQNHSHALQNSVEKLMIFIDEKKVNLPKTVATKMSTLRAKINQSAGAANERSRSRQAAQ